MDYHKNEYASVSNRYFSEGKLLGEWHGKLAQQFGLAGGVSEEAYERLANGQDPHNGKQLIKHRDTIITRSGEEVAHRSAWDFTIGSSKSVSAAALVGGDHRIIAAHDISVKKALDAIEEYTQARLGGNRSPETTGNMAFALFQHDTARPVGGTPDPHLHTHAVGFNMTQAADKIRSLDPKEMFRVQSYATAVYHAEMSVRLQKLGYELKHGRNFSMEIAGFSKDYLDSISRRRDQVEDQKKELGLKGAEWGERIAHSSREAKKAWEPQSLLAEWRKSAEGIGMDPESIAAEARSRGPRNAMNREEVSLKSHQGITFAKRRLSERTAVMDRYEIIRDALRHGMGSTTVDDVSTAFDKRTATESEFKQIGHYRAHAPGERYITPEMERMERDTLQFVRNGRGAYPSVAPEGFTKEHLREMYQSDAAAVKLNHGQMRMIWDAINTPDRVVGIQGGAGTGKTTALRSLGSFLEASGYEVHGLATTTGAARELRSSLGNGKVETVQRFLLAGSPDQRRPRAYFIDESSLVDTVQTYRLFKYLEQHHPEDRVFLVGDKRQHQSIGAGRIFEELQQSGMETFRLDKIVRQKSEELKAAVSEFARGDVKAGLNMLDEQGKIREVPNRNRRFERMAKDFAGSEGATLIISPDNDSRQEINVAVRQELKRSGDVGPDVYRGRILANRQNVTNEDRTISGTYNIGDVIRFEKGIRAIGVKKHDYATVIDTDRLSNTVSIQFEKDRRIFRMNAKNHQEHIQIFEPEERSFAVGDRIQFTNPWKAKGIANREFGTITALDSKGRVELEMQESHRHLRFNLRDMPHVDHGYATTSYSAQGMTVDRAILHFDAGDSKSRAMLDKILAYVATSRARHEVVVYTNDKEELGRVMDKLNLHPKALSYEHVKEYANGKYDHALSVT